MRLLATYAVLAALVVALLAAAGYQVWQQLPHETDVPYPPTRVITSQTNPTVIGIGAYWPKDGYCLGEFTATVTETATSVIVTSFVDHHISNASCAGVGTYHQTAWADVKLHQALGSRSVVRASDGMTLPLTSAP